MLLRHLWIGSLIGILTSTPSFADIAPTAYAGGTLVPLEISDLRFEDAHVSITWGTPCRLEATFEIASGRKDPITLEIGFPVGGYDPVYGYDQASDNRENKDVGTEAVSDSVIAISVNGAPSPAFRRINIPKQCEIRFGLASWYFTNATLSPGINHIALKTHLKPSGVYGRPYERRLEYCLWTGGRWNGRIKHETIEIAFPQPVSDTLIREVKPEFLETKGNRLIWDYTNIEPKDNFFDIDLVVRVPEIDQLVAQWEKAYVFDPKNTAAALKLAKHLFLLGNVKGNSGFPPRSFPITEYYRIFDSLDHASREIMARHYCIFRDTEVMERSSEWTDDRIKMIGILANADYCEDYPGVGDVLRAKRIVEGILRREPHNEEAWLLLLKNYWRFSFAAKGHWFGSTVLGKGQISTIRKAARNCPDSTALLQWTALLGPTKVKAADRQLPVSDEHKDSTEFDAIMKPYGNGYD